MRFYPAVPAALFLCATVQAATVLRYDDRTAFNTATSSRTDIDFEDVRNTCVALADVSTGTTVHNVLFIGGVGRQMANGPCSPALSPWKGYVLTARLVNRDDAPAQSTQIARLPGGNMAVGFELGVSARPALMASNAVDVTIVTDDGKEQKFVVTARATLGPNTIQPVFAGFVSTRPITEVRFRVPDVVDSTLMLDNFTFGQWGPPVVSSTNGVLNGASFLPQIAPNSWVSLFGTLFSPSARLWAGTDFNGTNLPTRVDDVSVTIGGRSAYVSWVSADQLNVLTPVDLPEGPANIVVTRGGMSSPPVSVQIRRIAPALFMFDAASRKYAAANHADGSPVGDTTLYPGATTPARPREVITLWGTGFGRTDPEIPAGKIVTAPGRLVAQALATIGGATAEVQFAGLTIAGVYQFNVLVPEGVPDGDLPVVIQVEGTTTQANAFITVRR
jgi:uncharacterized protein (TIGR03437 family)